MAAYNKFHRSFLDFVTGVHVLGTHQLMVALTNTAPTPANGLLADITQIAYDNISGNRNVTTVSVTQTTGTTTVVVQDKTITASGGSVGPFRYVVIYNDTPSSPAKPCIAFWDRGNSVTLNNGESILLDFVDSDILFEGV